MFCPEGAGQAALGEGGSKPPHCKEDSTGRNMRTPRR